jgi:hypothetical protein
VITQLFPPEAKPLEHHDSARNAWIWYFKNSVSLNGVVPYVRNFATVRTFEILGNYQVSEVYINEYLKQTQVW